MPPIAPKKHHGHCCGRLDRDAAEDRQFITALTAGSLVVRLRETDSEHFLSIIEGQRLGEVELDILKKFLARTPISP